MLWVEVGFLFSLAQMKKFIAKKKKTTKDPTTGECQQAFKDT
jgi:hypothetical protein